jgi:hypothetical protein
MGMPMTIAFCLTAPGVRFIVREIVLTGVLFFECFFSSRISTAVHSRRLVLAIFISPPLKQQPGTHRNWRTFAHRAL